MNVSTSARSLLRVATAPDHERVDRAFGAFDLADRADYRAFLEAQAYAFLPIEAAIDAADPRHLLPDWPARRRGDRLRMDLAELGIVTPRTGDRPVVEGDADILGTIYVLEGSRLGGAMLARSVPAEVPQRFLDNSSSKMWRDLIEMLDKHLVTGDQHSLAIDAARRTFAMFEDGALRHKGTKVLG